MRPVVPLSNLDALPWQPLGSPGLLVRELSRDPESGSRTAILRSAPRAAVEHKAQYHLGDEEFYCLEGEFTFDGVRWFGPGSYVHFPPRTVHGASVHVPVGYLLYLRTTGDATAHRVETPLRLTPYALEDPSDTLRAPTVRDTREAGPRRQLLREDAAQRARVELSSLRAGEQLDVGEGPVRPRVELMLIRGMLAHAGGAAVAAPAYGCYPDGLAEPLRATAASVVLAHVGDWP